LLILKQRFFVWVRPWSGIDLVKIQLLPVIVPFGDSVKAATLVIRGKKLIRPGDKA
jgi:hypothetical protein